jgi:hypothetical protein
MTDTRMSYEKHMEQMTQRLEHARAATSLRQRAIMLESLRIDVLLAQRDLEAPR